jgi:hypothetical protein
MIRGLNSTPESELGWLGEFAVDFRSRFLTLLSFPKFRDFGCAMALSILEAINIFSGVKALDAKPNNRSESLYCELFIQPLTGKDSSYTKPPAHNNNAF